MDKGQEQPSSTGRQRLDKWLFFARFAKSRAVAQKWISEGMVRVNGVTVAYASLSLKAGDRVDILSWNGIRQRAHGVEVLLPGTRRGPYEEARHLYTDLGWQDVEEQ